MGFRSFFFKVSFACLVLLACEAPHDNPYDPVNGTQPRTGDIFGFVSSYYPPHVGQANVTVLLSPSLQLAITDADGKYAFSGITPGRYQLKFSRPGYSSDSTQVELELFQKVQVDMRLNALPQCLNPRVFSHHLSDWGYINDIDQYEVHFRTRAVDPDGDRDIDSVFVRIDALNFKRALGFDSQTLDYYLIMPENKLPNRSLEALLGHPITFIARDKVGYTHHSLVPSLARIIETTPVALAPRGLQTVSKTPILQWNTDGLKYPHTFKVEVFYYTDLRRTITVRAWQRENINTNQDSIQVDNDLIAGYYFWVLWLTDEFGNSSRSKKAEFEVK